MSRIYHSIILLLVLLVCAMPATAASKQSFNKSVQLNGTSFDINSRAAFNFAAQIVTVTAKRGGKKVAALRSDVDHQPQSAEAVDLTGDGSPELVVVGKAGGATAAEALDVYWLNGTTLSRAALPEPEDKNGYKGGDRFHLEDTLIVRTIPVYRAGDAPGKPTGGSRELKYEFKGGAFTLYVQNDKPADTAAAEPAPVAAAPAPAAPIATVVPPVAPAAVVTPAPVAVAAPAALTPSLPVPAPVEPPSAAVAAPVVPAAAPQETAAAAVSRKTAPAGVNRPVVSNVTVSDAGIEIVTTSSPAKYRTMNLDKPERIAIDIPGADSPLAGRKITLNRFGVSKARIGRNKGFIRIVLDGAQKKFPKYVVKRSDNGILVEFPQ